MHQLTRLLCLNRTCCLPSILLLVMRFVQLAGRKKKSVRVTALFRQYYSACYYLSGFVPWDPGISPDGQMPHPPSATVALNRHHRCICVAAPLASGSRTCVLIDATFCVSNSATTTLLSIPAKSCLFPFPFPPHLLTCCHSTSRKHKSWIQS